MNMLIPGPYNLDQVIGTGEERSFGVRGPSWLGRFGSNTDRLWFHAQQTTTGCPALA